MYKSKIKIKKKILNIN